MDAYRDAALIYCMLICDACPAEHPRTLELEELDGHLTYSDDGWENALGDEARRRGWRVEYSDTPDGFLVLCPECAAKTKSD